MTKRSAAAASPVRVRTSSATRRPVPPAETLLPERIAFLGQAVTNTESADRPVLVIALCWPIVPVAWAVATSTWESLRVIRGERTISPAANAAPASWVKSCAAQLGSPFRDSTAEESTVAALVARTPMQIALGIVDVNDLAQATSSANYRQALLDCLASYNGFLKIPGRRACSVLFSRGQDEAADNQRRDDFQRCRPRIPDAQWLEEAQLRFWEEPTEPLQLELAQVAAASVVRHLAQPGATNPIFESVLSKLTVIPTRWLQAAKPRKR